MSDSRHNLLDNTGLIKYVLSYSEPFYIGTSSTNAHDSNFENIMILCMHDNARNISLAYRDLKVYKPIVVKSRFT